MSRSLSRRVLANSTNQRPNGVGVADPVLSDGQATMVPGVSERTGGTTKFSHLDRLGTNAKTTDASGAVVDSRRYDAFGLPISVTNPTNSQKGFASAFGIQEDSETGLKLMGHRYYDPGSGRFITRDPIGSGTNWYRYCDNNPLKQVDPSGLRALREAEKDVVRAQIKNMRANGLTDAANSLQWMLEHGRITAHDVDDGNWAETDEKNVISIDASLLKGAQGDREQRLWLQSVLFHEWIHTRQSAFMRKVATVYPFLGWDRDQENEAWRLQYWYLYRLYQRVQLSNPALAAILWKLLQDAEEGWVNNGNADKHQNRRWRDGNAYP